ncbi:Blp family class II bacteriocin [Oceanivirga salmonicida]|uniref:Blp family class II bacteriocin n=1 Tax=Oceanivirga salmonicida TaxID=1769291 RepID=UPI0018CC0246|nr:Blp family class II bacteriocin [Oceanivirga salmonicida]
MKNIVELNNNELMEIDGGRFAHVGFGAAFGAFAAGFGIIGVGVAVGYAAGKIYKRYR